MLGRTGRQTEKERGGQIKMLKGREKVQNEVIFLLL